jgi:hypothetical protein
MSKHDLVFFERRSTPQVVEHDATARTKKGYGAQSSRRPATAEEEVEIAQGRWLRVDEAGRRPASSQYRISRFRTRLGAKRQRTNKRLKDEGK